MKKEPGIQVLVWSFSGYRDVLRITLSQLRKFADVSCPVHLVILGDTRRYIEEIIGEVGETDSFKVERVVTYREGEPFWKKVRKAGFLRMRKSFLFIQDDFILFEKPNWPLLLELLGEFEESRWPFLRLVPSGHQTSSEKKHEVLGVSGVEVNSHSSYHFSWQATFWKRSSFFLLNFLVQPRSIRSENNGNYRKWMSRLSMNGLAFLENLFPYVQTAIRRGKWDTKATPGGDVLLELLQSYGVDPNVRGIRELTKRSSDR